MASLYILIVLVSCTLGATSVENSLMDNPSWQVYMSVSVRHTKCTTVFYQSPIDSDGCWDKALLDPNFDTNSTHTYFIRKQSSFNISSLDILGNAIEYKSLDNFAKVLQDATGDKTTMLNIACREPVNNLISKLKWSGNSSLWSLRVRCSLQEVPRNFVLKLMNLVILDLSHNRLTSLPIGFFRKSFQLRVLKLNYNPLSVVSPNFLQRAPLSELILADCSISRIDKEAFYYSDHIDNIILDGNNLQDLSHVKHLPNTTYLGLSNNSISRIRADDFRGLLISDLKLSWNNITSIEGSFSELGSLTSLDISYNSLTSLYCGLFPTTNRNLKHIDFSHNLIAGIANGTFSKLSSLMFLGLGYNLVEILEDTMFYGLESLHILNLSENLIKHFEQHVFNDLIRLMWLDLRKNRIQVLPREVFNRLGDLLYLDLSNNDIISLQLGVFNGLVGLASLDLTNNQIQIMREDVFNGLGQLHQLNLSNNRIESLPYAVFNGLQYISQLDRGLFYHSWGSLPCWTSATIRFEPFQKQRSMALGSLIS